MSNLEENIKKMENIIGLLKEKSLKPGIVKGCVEIKDILSELSQTVQSEKDHKKLERDVGGLVGSLLSACENDEQAGILGGMRQLRDKVRYFKHYITNK